jgi:hypothetical protein
VTIQSIGLVNFKKAQSPTPIIPFNKAIEAEGPRSNSILGNGVGRQVADVRASFARIYRPKGGGRKNADAERQAFKRALTAVLEEGTVHQESWEGADWLWRKDE